MRTRTVAIFTALVVLVWALFSTAHAAPKGVSLDGRVRGVEFSKAVPGQLNYQGFLADAADSSAVTATLEMTFRLFDSETKGAELWSETHPAVEVSNGLFQVLLGSITSFSSSLFDEPSLWLQTEVGPETLTPRKPLASVAYSQRTEEADHALLADDADQLEGQTLTDLDDRWVNEDQASSVTSAMITDGEIVDADVSVTADIHPGKIAGTAWTADNDGAGSGLDADMLDGQHAADFIGMADLDHLNAHDGDPLNAVYVNDAGKVGVGTSSPLTELDVNGSVNATTYYGDGSNLTGVSGTPDGDWTISGSDLYSAVSGNVGIGTSSPPTEKLHVVGSSGNYSIIAAPTYGAYARNVVQDNYGYLGGTGYGVYGKNNSSNNYGYLGSSDYGVFGRNHSSANEGYLGGNDCGAYGENINGNYGHLGSSNYGVYGYSVQSKKSRTGMPTSYDGVRGEGSGPAANGVYGLHVDSGNFASLGGLTQAVYGYHSGSGNYGYLATDNHGVFGVHGTAVGGEGSAGVVGSSVSNAGVRGYSTDHFGVVGYSAGWTVPAVAGYHSGDGPAIYGSCSGAYPCVEGLRSDGGTAVGGYSDTGYGVIGHASSTAGMGVAGMQTDHSWSDISIYGNYTPGGLFGGRNGVIGYTKTYNGYAVMGRSISTNTSSWAGYFASDGSGVYIYAPSGHTGLTVVGGSKNALVPTEDGSRLLYCEESTEVWFSDHGFGQLQNGRTTVDIDPLFAQTVNLDEPYHVFIQVYGDADVYVANRTADHFEVRLRNGDPSVEFSYRIMAKRTGYEQTRLEHAAWADNDPNLYPDRKFEQQKVE